MTSLGERYGLSVNLARETMFGASPQAIAPDGNDKARVDSLGLPYCLLEQELNTSHDLQSALREDLAVTTLPIHIAQDAP